MPDGERHTHRYAAVPAAGAGPADVLVRLGRDALEASQGLFAVDPALGDPLVQRCVDSFVEQAVDALRAIAELTGEAGAPDRSWVADPGPAIALDPEWPRW